VSPVFGDFAGLPPLLLVVGDAEVMLDDSVRVAERARAAGVDARLDVWPEMIHGFPLWAPVLPEGRGALAKTGNFVRAIRARSA
jgi:acetyl esterase/lipase